MDWSTDFYDHIHGFLSMLTALSKMRKRKEGGGRKEGTRTNLWSSTNQTKYNNSPCNIKVIFNGYSSVILRARHLTVTNLMNFYASWLQHNLIIKITINRFQHPTCLTGRWNVKNFGEMLYFECFCNVSVIWFWGVGETLRPHQLLFMGRIWI